MTVSSTTKRNSYTGNGSTTTFAYSFKIFDDDDITVILRTTATGAETVQTKTTHYSVTGVGSASGGNVVFGSAPTSAQTVVLLRQTAQTQATDYTPNDPFPAASHEDALDKLTLMTQDQQDELDRSIKLSRTNTMTSTEFTVGATDRANKILAFDSSGELSVTQELGTNRGDWAASTSYNQRDIVKDTSTGNIFFVNEAHTSSGSQPLTTNTNSSKYDLLIESLFSGVTAGTVSASKGVLVDGNKDITGFRNITLSGELTLGSGAVINETELEAIDGVTAGTVAASKAVVVDSNKDAASFRNITLTGELDAGSLDISGDADIDGTLEADAMTLNGTAITATATLDTGISNNNVPKFTSGVADNDFLRVDGTAIEGRSASEVLSDIAAAPAAGDSNIVTTGALNSGSITSGFGAIDNGSSNITTTGVGTFGSLDISGDIDVDGTTNLDVVDIDGAVDMASTLQVDGAITSSAGATISSSSSGEFNALTISQANNTSGNESRIRFKRTTDAGSDREVAAIVADRVGGNDTALAFEVNTDGADGAVEKARLRHDGTFLLGATSVSASGSPVLETIGAISAIKNHTDTSSSGNVSSGNGNQALTLINNQGGANNQTAKLGFSVATTGATSDGLIEFGSTAAGSGEFRFYTEASNTIANRMTLDSSGLTLTSALDVTTTTHANASVFKSTGNAQLFLQDTDASSNDQFWGLQASGGAFNIITCDDDRAGGFVTPISISAAGNIDFAQGKTTFTVPVADNPCMTITGSGTGNQTSLVVTQSTSNAFNMAEFRTANGTSQLNIGSNGNLTNTNNSYGQISDQKLKENIADAASQWNDIKSLQVRKFNFIGDDLTQIGVVAQELESAGMNGLVVENTDRDPDTFEDLGTTTKEVKYSVLYMKAVKALQEAMTRIETLEAKVTALENAQ